MPVLHPVKGEDWADMSEEDEPDETTFQQVEAMSEEKDSISDTVSDSVSMESPSRSSSNGATWLFDSSLNDTNQMVFPCWLQYTIKKQIRFQPLSIDAKSLTFKMENNKHKLADKQAEACASAGIYQGAPLNNMLYYGLITKGIQFGTLKLYMKNNHNELKKVVMESQKALIQTYGEDIFDIWFSNLSTEKRIEVLAKAKTNVKAIN